MIREEALRGAKINDFATNNTITGKISMVYFPEDVTLSEILDENGNDVTTTYLGASGTTGKQGCTIAPPEGSYFSSITGSAGFANFVEA